MEAGQVVYTGERRQGFKIACLEEIAYQNAWLSLEQLKKQGQDLAKTDYGQYLLNNF
jgi:glucose-1-phosphate thymidylyltransferase